MSKKPCIRGCLDRQHGKWVKTLSQSEWQNNLQYLLNTLKVVALEKVSFSNTVNPKTVS